MPYPLLPSYYHISGNNNTIRLITSLSSSCCCSSCYCGSYRYIHTNNNTIIKHKQEEEEEIINNKRGERRILYNNNNSFRILYKQEQRRMYSSNRNGINNNKYYKILGLDNNANETDIKTAYKKMAFKYHPDRPEGDAEKFKEISQAYEVLSDKDKKRIYDQYGEEGLNGGGFGSGGGGSGANPFSGSSYGFQDPFDLFAQMFGSSGGGGFGRSSSSSSRHNNMLRTPDVYYVMTVSLEQLYNGFTQKVKHKRDIKCNECNGFGAHKFDNCYKCNGSGIIIETRKMGYTIFQQQSPCPICKGKGYKIPKDSLCNKCNGNGYIKENDILNINILPGTEDYHKIVYNNMASERVDCDNTGDVIITLITNKPSLNIFGDDSSIKYNCRLSSSDLVLDKTITLSQALCGFTFPLKHLDGNTYTIKMYNNNITSSRGRMDSSYIIRPGDIWVINSMGMPIVNNKRGGYGDMYIRFNISFPKALSDIPENDRLRIRDNINNTLSNKEDSENKQDNNNKSSGGNSNSIIQSVKNWFTTKTYSHQHTTTNTNGANKDSISNNKTEYDDNNNKEGNINNKGEKKETINTLYAKRLNDTERDILNKRINNEERKNREREANYKRQKEGGDNNNTQCNQQ